MISVGSKVFFIDNCGARFAVCIKILNKFRDMKGFVGNILVVSIRRYRRAILVKNRLVKIGDVCLTVLISSSKIFNRAIGGSSVCFGYNGVVLLNSEYAPRAKKLNHCVALEIRRFGFSRLVLLARGLY